MSNNKNQTQLQSLNIFGDLQAGDPSVSLSDNLGLFPLLFDIETFFDSEKMGEIFGPFGTFAAIVGLASISTIIKRNAFSKEYAFVTDMGIYYSTSVNPNGLGAKTKLTHDPIRQSLGSVRCVDTVKNNLNDWEDKAQLSFIRNTKEYNVDTVGYNLTPFDPSWAKMPVFNPQKSTAALDQIYNAGGSYAYWNEIGLLTNPTLAHPTVPLGGRYEIAGLKRIGVTDLELYNQYEMESFGREEICIFTKNTGDYASTYENFNRRLSIMNLFFTADQKTEGVSLLPVTGYAQLFENNTVLLEAGLTAEDIAPGFNDTIIFKQDTVQGSQIIHDNEFVDSMGSAAPKEQAKGYFLANTLMPAVMKYFADNIMYNNGVVYNGRKPYYDHSFSCKKAIDASYFYLLPSHTLSQLSIDQPVAAVMPEYNFLSLKYEAAMSSYGNILSEKALPNIYLFDKCNEAGYEDEMTNDWWYEQIGIPRGCHEKYNFEKFGSKILDCGKINKIQDMNEDETSKKMSNIIINALQGGENSMNPSLKESVLEQLVDYPMYVDVRFTGDEQDTDKDNRSLFEEPDKDEKKIFVKGEEIVSSLHECGVVHEFIKTLIHYQYSGENATNPPATDVQKFALFGSSNLAIPTQDPGLNKVVVAELPENDYITGNTGVYGNRIYVEEENKTVYNFDEWIKAILAEQDQPSPPELGESLLYQVKDIKKTAVDITEPILNKKTKIDQPWFQNAWFMEKFNTEFLANYIAFRNGATRSYKQCTSEVLDRDGNLRYLNSVQGTLFYRIAKYDQDDNLIQNIFIPATSAKHTKLYQLGPPDYRYIDTQVKYGKIYKYKISAFKIVFGTKYSYNFTPYDTPISAPGETVTDYNTHLNRVASAFGYDTTSRGDYLLNSQGDFGALEAATGYGYAPVYTELNEDYQKNLIDGFMDDNDGSVGGAVADAISYGGVGNDLTIFSVTTQPSVRIYEVPYFEDSQVVVLDKPPISPIVNIYPLAGQKNKLLISFENQTGIKHETPIPILEKDYYYFNAERIHQKKAILKKPVGNSPEQFYFPNLEFKSDGFPSAYEVFRMDGVRPTSYADFAAAKYGKIFVKEATSFEDNISTNIDYYYTFRTTDIHGNISNPSPVYNVRMVEDSGAVYPLINVINLEGNKEYVGSREFNRYLQIDVADIHKYLNFEKSSLTMQTAFNPDIQPFLSMGQEGDPWNNQLENGPNSAKRFKFRVKSKQTGRIVDLNVGFHVRHENPTQEENSCNDEITPFKPGNNKQNPVDEAHTGNPDSYFNAGDKGKKIV